MTWWDRSFEYFTQHRSIDFATLDRSFWCLHANKRGSDFWYWNFVDISSSNYKWFLVLSVDSNKKSCHVDKFLLLNLIYSLLQKYINNPDKLINAKIIFRLYATITKNRSSWCDEIDHLNTSLRTDRSLSLLSIDLFWCLHTNKRGSDFWCRKNIGNFLLNWKWNFVSELTSLIKSHLMLINFYY